MKPVQTGILGEEVEVGCRRVKRYCWLPLSGKGNKTLGDFIAFFPLVVTVTSVKGD